MPSGIIILENHEFLLAQVEIAWMSFDEVICIHMSINNKTEMLSNKNLSTFHNKWKFIRLFRDNVHYHNRTNVT